MRSLSWILLPAIALFVANTAWPATVDDQPSSILPILNRLTDREKANGWRLLFDGKTTNDWRSYQQKAISPGWKVVDGALCRMGGLAHDIVYNEPFESLILELNYKNACPR